MNIGKSIFLSCIFIICGTTTLNAQEIQSAEQLTRSLGTNSDVTTRGLGGSQGFNSGAGTGRATMGAIQFEYNSTQLTRDGALQVQELAKAIKMLANESFEIVGHTDASGTETYNMNLSQQRAKAVAEYLVNDHGINPARLTSVGKGESVLLETNNPNSGKNRRVEVINTKALQN